MDDLPTPFSVLTKLARSRSRAGSTERRPALPVRLALSFGADKRGGVANWVRRPAGRRADATWALSRSGVAGGCG